MKFSNFRGLLFPRVSPNTLCQPRPLSPDGLINMMSTHILRFSIVVVLFLFISAFLGNGISIAESKQKYRIAILPPDLHDNAHVYTSFINKAISDGLPSKFEVETLSYFYKNHIKIGGQRFDLKTTDLWYKKKFFTLRYQPKLDYVKKIGKSLKVDAILMYSIRVEVDATDYIHTYLIDIATGQEYYQSALTRAFNHIYSGEQEGYGAIVNTTRKVLADQHY